MKRPLVACLSLVPMMAWAQPNAASINTHLAKKYFDEMKATSDRDAGALWGVQLYGPMMFADSETRQVVANQADIQGRLHESDGVFVGTLPPEMAIANTGVDWAGVRWTMVMWPLPQNRRPRIQLMAHESFHRAQPQLGFKAADSSNNHLGSRLGRTWLQMEWRALNKALATQGQPRTAAITDALYFRTLRRKLIPNAAGNENNLEMNEGIAEYTGVKLSARYPEEAALVASTILWQAANRSPFERSFAYVSGPAYGMLLDASGVPWRKQIKPDADFGALVAQAYRLQMPSPTENDALARAQKYDGDELIAQETDRDIRQQKVIAEAREKLIQKPILVLPAGPDVQYGFDPNNVTAVDEDTSVYGGNVQVSDAWGVLRATREVLLVRKNGRLDRVQVPAPVNPNGPTVSGDGWTLELKAGWKLAPGSRAGDWTVKQE